MTKPDVCIGDDRIHGNVMTLRTDRLNFLEVKPDADHDGLWMKHSERSIKIPTSEPEPVTLRVKPDNRGNDDIRLAFITVQRNRDIQDTARQFFANPPGSERERLALFRHHRQQACGALG
ncbi:hypothetical protein D3C72_288790 [compost metagenome]